MCACHPPTPAQSGTKSRTKSGKSDTGRNRRDAHRRLDMGMLPRPLYSVGMGAKHKASLYATHTSSRVAPQVAGGWPAILNLCVQMVEPLERALPMALLGSVGPRWLAWSLPLQPRDLASRASPDDLLDALLPLLHRDLGLREPVRHHLAGAMCGGRL